MKPTTVLYIVIVFMQLLTLVDQTFLDGQWSGIVMWLSTMAFIAATLVFSMSNAKKPRADHRAKAGE